MSQYYQIRTQKGEVIATHIVKANSFMARAKGLLGHQTLNNNEGMWISPCNSIHTFFMKFSIDVIFINKQNKIMSIVRQMPPWRLSWIYWRAHSCIELAAGTLKNSSIEKGQNLLIEESKSAA